MRGNYTMSAAHAHLLLNHIPILGTLFGLLPLLYALVRNIRGRIVAAPLALAVISVGLGMWAGNLGGQVRHTEVRAGFSK